MTTKHLIEALRRAVDEADGDARGDHLIFMAAAASALERQVDVVLELRAVAKWIRTPGNINPDDARDECARVLENRADALDAMPTE